MFEVLMFLLFSIILIRLIIDHTKMKNKDCRPNSESKLRSIDSKEKKQQNICVTICESLHHIDRNNNRTRKVVLASVKST